MEEVKSYLGCIRHHIESIIRPSCVIQYMMHWLQKDVIEQIKCMEETGLTNAAKLFIDKLLELEAEGWYRGFLDGLRAAEYTGLCAALEDQDFHDIESLEEQRDHLRLIYSNVKSNINPDDVVPHFQDILSQAETEEIKQQARTKGDTAGAEKLIDCLLRSDKKEWPKTLTLALESEGHTQVLQVWAPNKESTKKEAMDCNEEGEQSCFNLVQYSEEPDQLNSCLSAAPLLDRDSSSVEVNNSYPYEPAPVLTIRKYQDELAQPAYKGKNTIICAPTGSGKTFVALSICERHLKSMPEGKKGKVLFMATKVPVYEQQKDVFCKYFEGSDYGVVGFCGETSENVPIGLALESYDIIIMTPQILVNCLQEGSVSSVSIFTLMIFDECHNTIGSHPYNVIMFHYMDMKHGSTKEKCPQIVGLTASVATGKSKTDEPTHCVRKLCASLDTEVLSTVKENLEELEEIVYKPEKLIHETERRQKDPFTEIMSAIMSETEQMAKAVLPCLDSLSNIQNRRFGTQKYEQWIVDTQRKCRIIPMESKDEERRICQALFTYTEYLRKYNDALMINDDARTKDALDYLKDFIHNVKNGSYNSVEQEVTKVFEDKLLILEKTSEENLNPKLDDVQFILKEAYRENPQTRTLLFVKTRALVSALKKWIDDNPNLSFLKPDILIGRNKRNDNIGMSLPSQKGALESFKSDNGSKLMIATSVADEGIDIPACNLVLLYEYVGNVTKMIQVRGRGRAKDSQCILVTSKRDEAEKERNNLLHEELMTIAVEHLQNEYQQNRDAFLKKINDIQKDEKYQRDIKKSIKGPELTEENKQLLCGKCKTFACNTDDIRVLKVSHHTVIDPAFKDRYTTKLLPKPQRFVGYTKKYEIFCSNPTCQEEWGITGTYMKFQNIPLIRIDKFVILSQNGEQEYFSKWNKVTFKMKEFMIKEISKSFAASPENDKQCAHFSNQET
uniref:RNA helicase n=1 Tax=Leptobrachium leishanense TaxID=445787 RepID=A0A8C5LT37_9ANUR